MSTVRRFPFRLQDSMSAPVVDTNLSHYTVTVAKNGLAYSPIALAVTSLGGGRHLMAVTVDDAGAEYRAFIDSTVGGDTVVQQELVAVPGGASEVLAVYEGAAARLAPPDLWVGDGGDLMVRLRRAGVAGVWDVSSATSASMAAEFLDAAAGPVALEGSPFAVSPSHGLADWSAGLVALPTGPLTGAPGAVRVALTLVFPDGQATVLAATLTVRPRPGA